MGSMMSSVIASPPSPSTQPASTSVALAPFSSRKNAGSVVALTRRLLLLSLQAALLQHRLLTLLLLFLLPTPATKTAATRRSKATQAAPPTRHHKVLLQPMRHSTPGDILFPGCSRCGHLTRGCTVQE